MALLGVVTDLLAYAWHLIAYRSRWKLNPPRLDGEPEFNWIMYRAMLRIITQCSNRDALIDLMNGLRATQQPGVASYLRVDGDHRGYFIRIDQRVILLKLCQSTTHTFMLVGEVIHGHAENPAPADNVHDENPVQNLIEYSTLYGHSVYISRMHETATDALATMRRALAPSWWHTSIAATRWSLGF
jgi:hypothetical protein